jgi:hypothetical protein
MSDADENQGPAQEPEQSPEQPAPTPKPGKWKKGQSGNPSGKRKKPKEPERADDQATLAAMQYVVRHKAGTEKTVLQRNMRAWQQDFPDAFNRALTGLEAKIGLMQAAAERERSASELDEGEEAVAEQLKDEWPLVELAIKLVEKLGEARIRELLGEGS